jgi:hypothetical protein
MCTAHQHIAGHRQYIALAHFQQRGIIADTEERVRCIMGEVTADQVKFCHAEMTASRFMLGAFQSAQLRGQPIQHAINEFMAITSAKGLGKFNCFVDDDFIGHFGVMT